VRAYFRRLGNALIGRQVTEVEFSGRLRLLWKGQVGFDGRVVGYQINRTENLGGHEATVTLYDPDYDKRVLSMRVDHSAVEEFGDQPPDAVERYEQYGEPSHVEGVGRLRDTDGGE